MFVRHAALAAVGFPIRFLLAGSSVRGPHNHRRSRQRTQKVPQAYRSPYGNAIATADCRRAPGFASLHDAMIETWLKPNRRVLALAVTLPVVISAGGALLIAISASAIGKPLGYTMLVVGAVVAMVLIRKIFRPRLAYQDGQLLVFLTPGPPIAVPVNIVECFFLGRDDATVPMNAELDPKVVAVVTRLAEAAKEWQRRDVKPTLGKWQDGYIIIRGTWCEPIDAAVVTELNRRLREAHRELESRQGSRKATSTEQQSI